MYDLGYFSEKLESVGYKAGSNVHEAVSDALVAIEQHKLSQDEYAAILDLLSKFGRDTLGHYPSYGDDLWQEFNYGNVKVGDYVRVRHDAYDSDTGKPHNGKVGVLLNVSGRRCTVRYIGLRGVSKMFHPIDNLESLKHGVHLKAEQK